MSQFLRGDRLMRKKNLIAGHEDYICVAMSKRHATCMTIASAFATKCTSSMLSSGPHVTDLGKGPLWEVDWWFARVGRYRERSMKNVEVNSECQTGFGDRQECERATLPSRLSLDGDPEHARCSTMRSSMCLSRMNAYQCN